MVEDIIDKIYEKINISDDVNYRDMKALYDLGYYKGLLSMIGFPPGKQSGLNMKDEIEIRLGTGYLHKRVYVHDYKLNTEMTTDIDVVYKLAEMKRMKSRKTETNDITKNNSLQKIEEEICSVENPVEERSGFVNILENCVSC